MKYSLRYPKVAFNVILDETKYTELKEIFYKQANSIDKSNDNYIWINEYDTEYVETNPLFSSSDGPPIEVKKHFIEDFITNLVYKAEGLFKEGVMKELSKSETQGKSAVLILNNRYKEYIEYYIEELENTNHLPAKIKNKIKEALNRLNQFVDEELSINVFKDFSANKIKLKLTVQEICALVLYLDKKELIGGDTSRVRLIELIESHFMYQLTKAKTKTKEFEEIHSAKNTISNILGKGFRDPKRTVLEDFLVDFDRILIELRKKK